MHAEVSQTFDRPPSVVFRFTVTEHVRNHPRWDPQMEVWPITEGPIGLGTVLGRRQSRGVVPTEGTMDVVAFELDRAVAWVVHDGPFVLQSRTTYDPTAGGGTKMTTTVELPEGVKAFDPSLIERSMRNMKALIEAET